MAASKSEARRALHTYIDQKNGIRRLFGDPPLNADRLTAEDRRGLVDMLSADMSPENVSCDGELPRSRVAARMKFLKTVAEEVERLDRNAYELEAGW